MNKDDANLNSDATAEKLYEILGKRSWVAVKGQVGKDKKEKAFFVTTVGFYLNMFQKLEQCKRNLEAHKGDLEQCHKDLEDLYKILDGDGMDLEDAFDDNFVPVDTGEEKKSLRL